MKHFVKAFVILLCTLIVINANRKYHSYSSVSVMSRDGDDVQHYSYTRENQNGNVKETIDDNGSRKEINTYAGDEGVDNPSLPLA